MSDHPPIPPPKPNESWERVFDLLTQLDVCPTDVIKPLRAAIYRCAWLDEEKRLNDACLGQIMIPEYVSLRKKEIAARKNAEAWRLWGESKK
jgi:hypothetical protein